LEVFHGISDAANPEAMHKRAKVVELRARRWSFSEIGAELGLTGQRCGQLYREALAAIPLHNVDEHRAESIELSDRMVKNLLVITEDPRITARGRIDASAVIRAWEEHKAKTCGTYAPTRTEIMTISTLDQQIMQLEAELSGTET
jgi:hypothetical protein